MRHAWEYSIYCDASKFQVIGFPMTRSSGFSYTVVGVADCNDGWFRGKPAHYPNRGFMVDLEVQRGSKLPALHKERWFKTEAEARACAALFIWACEGLSRTAIARVAREHNGRRT